MKRIAAALRTLADRIDPAPQPGIWLSNLREDSGKTLFISHDYGYPSDAVIEWESDGPDLTWGPA